MDELKQFLSSGAGRLYVDRAGPGTAALISSRVIAESRSAVLAAKDSKSLHELLALARLFSPALSQGDTPPGQPVWDSPVLSLPPMRNFASREEWAPRMGVLYALALSRPACVVASFQSLLLRYVPRDYFASHSLDLACGMDFSPDLIIEQAMEWGYERAQMVTTPGEMARRGDILDIFPAGFARPLRLEFFGDTLEEMRVFDADSQRSLASLAEFTLIPCLPISATGPELDRAKVRIADLVSSGRADENAAYSFRKCLETGGAGLLPGVVYDRASFIEDWLGADPLWILPGESDCAEELVRERSTLKADLESDEFLPQAASLTLRRSSQPAPWNSTQCIFLEPLRMGIDARGLPLPERDLHSFSDLFSRPEEADRPWQTLVRALKGWQGKYRQILLAFGKERSRKKFLALAEQDGILPRLGYSPAEPGIFSLVAPLREGADLEWASILILGEDILQPRASRQPRSAVRAFKGLDNFDSLKPGELMVHRDYGIGRFAGLHHLEINGVANDFILLEYSGKDKLYIPADRLALIQRFKGGEGSAPALDRLGSPAWSQGKDRARKAIEKIAADLVEMYAYRKVAKSFSYPPAGELYREFEATFGFEETPDQARAIQDVLDDMDGSRPMDRLVCGDVGFGKTEVALRAAFRAASEGRQVALLCPTTVLAEQHYQTFRSRLAGFPVNVGLLSRFVPRATQKETLKACEQGQVDILIGTHRILSSDVKLPNLGLLILDEEQRFGVRHKEKLKAMKKNVDVLTLTATPIPRTLQLSMSGIRDLSVMETAPLDRKPVASAVITRDDPTLRKIVERELDRQGQVFWVYNRVHDLEKVAEYVRKLVPQARVGMAHGQMGEKELENTMRKFWHGELDVLVSTSIIESGLDFPRANTLVVDQAQMFGLGQLYQLRGRVGRSDKQAYAFFVVPDAKKLTGIAEERLRIILNMDYLGAGFQVAMEDLRLRGAGNILGEAQSGHIARVGLDLYLEMLEEEVRKLKGMPLEETATPTEISLGIPAHIPAGYIDDGRERLRYYKSLTSAQTPAAREEVALAMRDRFGPFPEEVRNFLAVLDLKDILARLDVEKADISANSVSMAWRKGQDVVEPARIMELAGAHEELALSPPATLIARVDASQGFSRGLDGLGKVLATLLPAPARALEPIPEEA